MKTTQTICAIVLSMSTALGTSACTQSNNKTSKCPTTESSFIVRVQQAEKYRPRLLDTSITNYNVKYRGIEVREKFEDGKFVGFEVYIHQQSACYHGMDTDIANLFQDAINKLEESRK